MLSVFDVAELTDLGVDQAAALTVNTDRLFAKYPSGHVKVMDHQNAPGRSADLNARKTLLALLPKVLTHCWA
jgi:hypothetical protein